MKSKIIVFLDLLSVMPRALEEDEKCLEELFYEFQRLRILYNADELVLSLTTNETIVGNRRVDYDVEQVFGASINLLSRFCSEYDGISLGNAFTKEFSIEFKNGKKDINISQFKDGYTQCNYVLNQATESDIPLVIVCDKNGRKYFDTIKKNLSQAVSNTDYDIPVILCENASYNVRNRLYGIIKNGKGDSFIISTAYKEYDGARRCINILNELKYLSLLRAKTTISDALKTNKLDVKLLHQNGCLMHSLEELIIEPSKLDCVLDYEEPSGQKIKSKKISFNTECPF